MFPKFLFIYILSSLIFTHSCTSQCLDHQKSLLLHLKNELIFNSSRSTKLVRWNQTMNDCCKWPGVGCDGAGNIVSLQLSREAISGGIGDSSTLFKLKYLEIVNLAFNKFSSTPIPKGIHNLTYLTTLILSGCDFTGSFPNTIFHIPTLQNLDLSWNDELSGSIPPFTQNGSLRSLVLRSTNFSGSIPTSISNLKTLSNLDLSSCRFTGSIPSTFANLTGLVHVDFSYNSFTGTLSPTLFEGLSNLVFMNLRFNSFTGNVPKSLFSLPSLQELWLGYNWLTGKFPTVNDSGITTLDLNYNRYEGPVPDSFFQLQSLESLFLEGNMFNGSFQLDKILNLPNLTSLHLSHNKLSIDIGNLSTHKLPMLKGLRLGSCNLHEFPDFIKQYNLSYLDLSNNGISGEIPSWIWGTQLSHLNLSHNHLTDLQKPYHVSPSLVVLDLRSNRLESELHLLIPHSYSFWYLLLSNNSLRGSIPTSLCTSKNLFVLDLSVNKLSGTIPSCLLGQIPSLLLLNLGRNNIGGSLPDNSSIDCNLIYLDLNKNIIEGKIPKSLERCKSLRFMNVGNNAINDTFPCMLPSSLQVLVMRSNTLHGEVRCDESWTWPELQILDISSNNFSGSLESINFSRWRAMAEFRSNDSKYATSGVTLMMKGLEMEIFGIWPDFGIIDISSNNFGGEIPNAIGDLRLLHLLNLSNNALDGTIPKSFGKLVDLESLDLSRNELTGNIPRELAELTFLSFLNLSYNKLVGEIPNGRQLQTFSADSFLGNPELCGFNLNISCTDIDSSPPRNEEEEDKREIEWGYVIAALGYVVGLGSFVWLLLFCRSFREKWFGKIDEVVEEMFDARDRRRRRRSHARRVERNRARRQ